MADRLGLFCNLCMLLIVIMIIQKHCRHVQIKCALVIYTWHENIIVERSEHVNFNSVPQTDQKTFNIQFNLQKKISFFVIHTLSSYLSFYVQKHCTQSADVVSVVNYTWHEKFIFFCVFLSELHTYKFHCVFQKQMSRFVMYTFSSKLSWYIHKHLKEHTYLIIKCGVHMA